MRYFAGLIGGTIVAVFLFAFQQHLIAGERDLALVETVKPTLPTVPASRPPEEKPYDDRELPPRPEPEPKPNGPADPGTERRLPVVLDIPVIDAAPDGHGAVPEIHFGGGSLIDRGLAVKYPVRPKYPLAAARNGIEGEVELEFTVLPDGGVADVRVVRAEPRGVFEQEAIRAILRWQFIPKRENGEPMAVRARQVIRFDLPERN